MYTIIILTRSVSFRIKTHNIPIANNNKITVSITFEQKCFLDESHIKFGKHNIIDNDLCCYVSTFVQIQIYIARCVL